MINLLADENVEGRVIALLRAEGYNVASIQETQSGVADETVLATSVASDTGLLTGDSDFGKLHFQQGHIHTGVLFYRLPRTTTAEKGQLILKTLQEYGDKLSNSFTVLTAKKSAFLEIVSTKNQLLGAGATYQSSIFRFLHQHITVAELSAQDGFKKV